MLDNNFREHHINVFLTYFVTFNLRFGHSYVANGSLSKNPDALILSGETPLPPVDSEPKTRAHGW